MKNYPIQILLSGLAIFFGLSMTAKEVLAGGSEPPNTSTQTTSTSTPVNSTVASPPTETVGSISVTPTTLLQTGSNNFANVNSNVGALGSPGCSGTCAFMTIRASPAPNFNGGGGGTQLEGIVGGIISFGSSDQTNAESNRKLVEIQMQKSEAEIAITYIKSISDSCNLKDFGRAELYAQGLARIWKNDYKTNLPSGCKN